MFYDTLSANTVKITLTKQDMQSNALNAESIRSRTAESRRSLTRFLKRFQTESALFPEHSAERLFLEAFPSEDGGCVMYVSTLGAEPEPSSPKKARSVRLMFAACDIGNVISLCGCVSRRIQASSLYRLDGKYCLVIRLSPGEADAVSHIIEEFGDMYDDETDIARACEHGRLICRTNAAGIMSRLA